MSELGLWNENLGSSSHGSNFDLLLNLAGNSGEPVGSFLELQRHGYRHPTKQHSPGKCVHTVCLSRKPLESQALNSHNPVD